MQSIVPVILCGGSGLRLWPLSSAAMPKPFHVLAGHHSLFQQALLRAVGAPFSVPPIAVVQARHGALARAQAAALGLEVHLVLEEQPRDTLPAALLGALTAEARHGPSIIVLLAADQHIPDRAAFAACISAALPAAGEGALAVLGLAPRGPLPDYGYILPAGSGDVAAVRRFAEKPTAALAQALIDEGALWNSGTFIVSCGTLLAAAERHAPPIAAAARRGFDQRQPSGNDTRVDLPLAPGDGASIDRALAEHFHDVRVVRASFTWSDVGSWDEVQRLSARDGLFVHSSGIPVKVVGFDALAGEMMVIATPEGVLVTRKGHSGALKQALAGSAP